MEYVIIGACIVVAIAGGIVLYVKNKRTKNELGNTAVVVSKTSSSKLQASEVANDPVIQIGILPADAISDETKLVEITDSKVLAHINNLVPGLAQAGNAANNATQAVKARLLRSITGLDNRTISNMKKGENLTKSNVISACLGIHIPFRVSNHMLSLADLTLNMTSKGQVGDDNETYDMFLHLKWTTDYDDIYEELKVQSKDYLIHQPPVKK